MTSTILILLGGLSLMLVGVGLLGTLLGVRATLATFSDLQTGLIMTGYYAGYILGTLLGPQIVRNVGHIRAFAAFAALGAATSLAFGLVVHPWVWLALRILNGLCVIGLYMVVESWLNAQSAGPIRARVFSIYLTTTLVALALGQFLLLAGDNLSLTLFAYVAILMCVGMVPVLATRITEPQIDTALPVGLQHLWVISPLGVMGVFCAGLVSGAFWGMAPVFGQRLALEESQIALFMSATIAGGILLQWPIGHLSDRLDRRTVLIAAGFSTAVAAAAAAYIVMHAQPGLVTSTFVYGGLMFSLYGLSVAHVNDHLESGQVLEATRGLLLVFGLGALLGPFLVGLAMQIWGPVGLPLVSGTVTAGLALFGIYRTTRQAAPPSAHKTEYVSLVRTTPVALEMLPNADPAPELDLTPGVSAKSKNRAPRQPS